MKKTKRLLSILLALAMVFTMLPISAFADEPEPESGEGNRIWPNEGAIHLEKTPTANSEDEWKFDLTLAVQGKNIQQTSDVVMVIDLSLSMDEQSRLTYTKAAAKDFVDKLLKDDGSGNVRIALVTFSKEAYTTVAFTKSKTELINAINGLKTIEGTNIQAGIKRADEVMSAASPKADNQYIVLLGDGEPTYSLKATAVTGVTYKHNSNNNHSFQFDPNTFTMTFDYNTTVGSGSSYNISTNNHKLSIQCDNSGAKHTGRFPENNGVPTVYQARLAKDKGYEIFSIALNAGDNGESVLRAVASGSNYYGLSSSNLSSLQAAYDAIGSKILYSAQDAYVEDEMGPYFVLDGTGYTIVKESTSGSTPTPGTATIGGTVSETTPVVYSADGKHLSWYIGTVEEGTTYKLIYSVKVPEGMKEGVLDKNSKEPDTLYDTNEVATIIYTDVDGNENARKNFPEPKVPLPNTRGVVRVFAYLVNEDGQPINEEGAPVDGDPAKAFIINGEGELATNNSSDAYNGQKFFYIGDKYDIGRPSNVTAGYAPYGSDNIKSVTMVNAEEIVYFPYVKVDTVDVTVKYVLDTYEGTQIGTATLEKVNVGTELADLADLYDTDGDKIDLLDGLTEFPVGYSKTGVVDADNSLTTVVKEDGKNVIYVVYAKDADQTKPLSYTVEYYKDGEFFENGEGGSETVQLLDPDTITVKEFDKADDKYLGYKLEKVDPNVAVGDEVADETVIKVYYVKDADQTKEVSYKVEYYKDGEFFENGEGDSETVQLLDPDTITVKEFNKADDKYLGYKLEKVDPNLTVGDEIASGTVIKVYYVKDDDAIKTVTYDVQYWIDGEEHELVDGKTETVWINASDKIAVSDVDTSNSRYEGYKLDETATGTIPSEVDTGTTINVYYVKDDSQTKPVEYNVQYWLDGVKLEDEGDAYTVKKDVWVNDTEIKVDPINTSNDRYPGATFDAAATGTIPTYVKIGNTINVYYKTREDLYYTVEYYMDSISEENIINSVSKYVVKYGTVVDESVIESMTNWFRPSGYKPGTIVSNISGIVITDKDTVIQILYTPYVGNPNATITHIYGNDGTEFDPDAVFEGNLIIAGDYAVPYYNGNEYVLDSASVTSTPGTIPGNAEEIESLKQQIADLIDAIEMQANGFIPTATNGDVPTATNGDVYDDAIAAMIEQLEELQARLEELEAAEPVAGLNESGGANLRFEVNGEDSYALVLVYSRKPADPVDPDPTPDPIPDPDPTPDPVIPTPNPDPTPDPIPEDDDDDLYDWDNIDSQTTRTINDSNIPLTNIPDVAPPLATIFDDAIPLAALPQSGGNAGAMTGSFLNIAGGFILSKKDDE